MPFLLLLLLSLACFPEKWPQPLSWFGIPDGDPTFFASLTALGAFALIAVAARLARRTRRALYLFPSRREETLHDFVVARHRLVYVLYAFFILAVFVLGWGWTVQTWLTPRGRDVLLPGAELLVLLPYLLPLTCFWVLYYDVEQAVHVTAPPFEVRKPYWGRWAYVRFHLRQNLALVVAPLLLLILAKGVRRLLPSSDYDQVVSAASGLLLVSAIVCLPWILRLALGLTPLPAGPVRARLERCAERLHFRYSNILVWNTRGGVANAMVAGLLPWIRYVLLTDRLLEELTPDELEAVFGHEIGHVKHRHMFYYMAFLVLSLFAVGGLWQVGVDALTRAMAASPPPAGSLAAEVTAWLAPAADKNDWDLQVVPLFALIGTYLFVVFGFLSRRCERQADIFGCRAVSCLRPDCGGHAEGVALAPRGSGLCPTGIRIFIEALEKVACVNGISRHKPGWLQSWQHSTIARRVEFLQRVLLDPTLEPRFQRTVGLVKWGLFLTLTALLCWLGTTLGWDKFPQF